MGQEKKKNRTGVGSSPQKTLELFLDVELLHSLGCYRDAEERAQRFAYGSIRDTGGALNRTRVLNSLLREHRDRSSERERHPNPSQNVRGEKSEGDDRLGAEPDAHTCGLLLNDRDQSRERLRRITDFYSTGIVAMDGLLKAGQKPVEPLPDSLDQLGSCLFWDREPASSVRGVNDSFRKHLRKSSKERWQETLSPSVRSRVEAKRDRFIERRMAVEAALKPKLTHRREWEATRAGAHAEALLSMNLSPIRNPGEDCVTPGFVLQCFVAAHLRLHRVEHFLSYPFQKAMTMSSVETEEVLQRLREAESLNTFVYVVSRSLPWIFARDDEEMGEVLTTCENGFGAGEDGDDAEPPQDVNPAVFKALWRSQRLSFLALHRRAFGHSLRDALESESFNDTAFKDFHKLQRLLRVQWRVLEHALDVEVSNDIMPTDFVAALDALAETHIGDLYRSDHAHPVALNHFCDAVDRLQQLSEDLLKRDLPDKKEAAAYEGLTEGPPNVATVLQDSRWRVHLMMSKGKGFYEAGNLKRSVKWLLRSWSALLVLIHRQEKGLQVLSGEGNLSELSEDEERDVFKQLSEAIKMLSLIKNDPDFSKEGMESRVKPVIETGVKIDIPANLTVIASEILLRLGHVLFVIRLDPVIDPEGGPDKERHRLARKCLERAGALDGSSTLVLADQLKIEHQRGKEISRRERKPPDLQWPYGRGNPEQLIRVIEYHLIRWLAIAGLAEMANKEDQPSPLSRMQDRRVARKLISGLLTHTDSINVRQSQVYRYLMQPKRPARSIGPAEGWQAPRAQVPLAEPMRPRSSSFVCVATALFSLSSRGRPRFARWAAATCCAFIIGTRAALSHLG